MANQTYVVPNSRGGWDIKNDNSVMPLGHTETKQEAVDQARNVSRALNTELVIHRQDGTIEKKDSHGRDPFPPRG